MNKPSYFKSYTMLFFISALFLCSWFCLTGRTFIYNGDGMLQHYPALVYYAKYLRSIIRSFIFGHHLVIPNWDFSIGEGSDILGTLHYYVIGDPFAFFSVFVPARYIHLYYGGMILLRLYLAGIAFSCLCFQTNLRNTYGILAGSLTYVFCYWALHNVVGHPYFLNPLLYMPMILIGINKILKNERPYFYIISVFLSAISNFYFFYMIVLITIIYVFIIIIFFYHKNLLLAALQVCKIGAASILGILLAAAIFLPIFYTFINDARMSVDNTVHLFYPLSYYSSLPARFLSSDSNHEMFMGFAAPILPAIFLLFYKKQTNRMTKLLFLISILITLFPVFGHIFNGFSYVTNRWSWAFALLCSYILSIMWESLMKLRQKEAIFLIFVTFGYFVLCLLLEYSRKNNVFTAIILILFFLFLLYPVEKETYFPFKVKQRMALFLVIISIFLNIFWVYSAAGDNRASLSAEARQLKEEYPGIDAAAIKQLINTEETTAFYRYSGEDSSQLNSGFKAGLSSTSFFWTLSNPYTYQFRKEMDIKEGRPHKYSGYDTRTILNALSSVRYYVSERKSSLIPYGFTYLDTINVNNELLQSKITSIKKELHTEALTKEQIKAIENTYSKNYFVYKNDIPLPIAYSYNKVLSEETWNNLTSTEKQEAMLQAVCLKDYASISDYQSSELELISQRISYSANADSNGISIQNNSFVVTTPNASITLEFDGLPNSETYFSVHNLTFTEKDTYDLYFGNSKDDPFNLYNKTIWKSKKYSDREIIRKNHLFQEPASSATLSLTTSTGMSTNLRYLTEEYSWYNNRHDFIVNMGYSNDKVTKLTISFSNIGTYSFDSIEIICQPMDNYISEISELRKDVLENVTLGTDSITGNITLDNPRILCFSIPYSIGWKAKVNGKEVPLYQANTMYMGIPLDAGEYNISLEYSTPFLKEGIYISCISLFIFIFYVIFSERKRQMH